MLHLSRLTPEDVAMQNICSILAERGERLTFENILERLQGIEQVVKAFKECSKNFHSVCWQALKSLVDGKIVFREEREV